MNSFHQTSLCEITLPPNLTEIQGNSLRGVENITEITIPAKVMRFLGGYEIAGCPKLNKVTMLPVTPPSISSTSGFYGKDIYVPAESLEAYKTANVWSAYADRIFAIQE